MTGQIDSTPGPRKGATTRRAARLAFFSAVAALVVISGMALPTATIQAQAPAPSKKAPAKTAPTAPSSMPAPAPSRPIAETPPDDPGPPLPDRAPLAIPSSSGKMKLPPPETEEPAQAPAPLDARVLPAEVLDGSNLPPAASPPGGGPINPGSGSGPASDPFALPLDRMGLGKQKVLVSVEVQASPIINLGKETTVRLVVKNESQVDASGVSLVYELPENLKMNSSTPPATPVPSEKALYIWRKEMLPANGEWVVVLKVVATSTKPCEQGATVSAKTGSKVNTIVQEPKLKVEVTPMPGRVLKGEQVTFQISVTNNGTGPARNVTVQAKLSSGLRYGGDVLVQQTINELTPGQRFDIEPLIVDTVAGGKQSCTVDASSLDVTMVAEDQRVTRNVEVTKPELVVKLEGQEQRFTGQTAEYKLIVSNPGTAPAKKVKVVATMPPQGGKLAELPKGAKWDLATRKLFWTIPQLEPLQTVEYGFLYATSSTGLYRATAEATSGELRSSDTMSTEVVGIAVLDLQITQTNRVMDVGKLNYYDITIKNSGTKEATRLQLSGSMQKNLKITQHYNVEKGEFKFNSELGAFVFPEIDRLGVGQTITLSLEVQATESGPGGCKVQLAHAEMSSPDDKVEDVISTTVTSNNRSKSTAKP